MVAFDIFPKDMVKLCNFGFSSARRSGASITKTWKKLCGSLAGTGAVTERYSSAAFSNIRNRKHHSDAMFVKWSCLSAEMGPVMDARWHGPGQKFQKPAGRRAPEAFRGRRRAPVGQRMRESLPLKPLDTLIKLRYAFLAGLPPSYLVRQVEFLLKVKTFFLERMYGLAAGARLRKSFVTG